MGPLDALRGRRAYLDANVFIYAASAIGPYAAFLSELFRAIDAAQVEAFSSELTVMEVLVAPLRRGNAQEEVRCRGMLQPRAWLHFLPVSLAILETGARLRASTPGLHTPDAIHLATAMDASCDVFLTNDRRIRTVVPPAVVLFDDLLRA